MRPKDPCAREQTKAGNSVSVKIPVPDSTSRALVILEDRWIERQPNECGTKEGDRDETQTAMRHSMEEPKESKPFQGPSECDPLALKLEWKNHASRESPLAGLAR